jgi:hypothetical protein
VSYYLNSRFDDGERLAVEIATVKGWSDFCRWAKALPRAFALVKALAQTGGGKGSERLEGQLRAALKAKPPATSARQVVETLADVVPYSGTLVVNDEPDDSEME